MNVRSAAILALLSLTVLACGASAPLAGSPNASASSTATAQPSAAAEVCLGPERALGWDAVPPIVRRLGDAWMAPDQPTRLAILDEIWADDGVYVNAFDEGLVIGRRDLADYMEFGMADNYLEITDWMPIYLHNNRVQIRWRDCCPNRTILLTGTEYGEFDADGRYTRVTSFWDHYVEDVAAVACS